MTTVLVTGATGFLGSWVTRALLEASYEVRALVRQTRSGTPSRTGERSVNPLPPSVEVAHGDVEDRPSLERAMQDVQAVVHTAGLISLRPRDRDALFRVNVGGTLNVLEAARPRGLRVLHTSSIATLGPTLWPELRDERAAETCVASGYAYEESKCAAERLTLHSAREGQDTLVLCPGVMLGPGDPRFSSTRFVRHYLRGELRLYLGGGTSFCDVRDVAAAYVSALQRGRAGERYVVAGNNLTYREAFEALWELTRLFRPFALARPVAQSFALWSDFISDWFPHPFEELNGPVIAFGQRFNFCDLSKAVRDLGYRVSDFRTTLSDTLVDHLARGVARATTPELSALMTRARS